MRKLWPILETYPVVGNICLGSLNYIYTIVFLLETTGLFTTGLSLTEEPA